MTSFLQVTGGGIKMPAVGSFDFLERKRKQILIVRFKFQPSVGCKKLVIAV